MRLSCNHISFKYSQSGHFVFKDLSVSFARPGLHALFGPSGVGKTSFAKIITGDLKGYSGDILTTGVDTLLYSYNTERLPGWSNVGNHLNKITPPKNRDKKEPLIDLFGLNAYQEQRFSQLSLGQQNRVNLLRYLLQDFDLLIMDESLANVDEPTRETILLGMKDLFPDVIFLYISHNVIEVSKFCDQIVVFKDASKDPQIKQVTGQNHRIDAPADKIGLETTMLEIMNVS